MAFDWDFTKERLYGFESFKNKDVYIDVIAALPDNSKILLFSNQKKKLYSLTRSKKENELDKVMESLSEIKILSKP